QGLRQPAVTDDDVTGLTVLSHDARQDGVHRLRLAVVTGAGDQAHVVGRVVQRGADVVAHPAVDADVPPHPLVAEHDILDGAGLVKRDRARTGDGAPRLPRDPRHRDVGERALLAHDVADLRDQLRGWRRVVLLGVGDTEPTAEVDG